MFAFIFLVGLASAAQLDKRIIQGQQNAPDTSNNLQQRVSRSQFDPIDADGCGQRPLMFENGVSELGRRIVGGQVSVPYSWPAMCSLRNTTNPDVHKCGANLVTNLDGQYFIVTAAHCITDPTPNRYVAYCGIFDTSVIDKPHRYIVTFSSVDIHPDYDYWTLDYDIAIFTLASQPPTNDYIQPICIPNESWSDGELAIVSGWGALYLGGNFPYELHQVTKPIKPRSVCKDRYGSATITNRMICAGVEEGGLDSCTGDTGGPLATYREGRWTLTGVVSWGLGCGEQGRPGVYTDVFVVKQWMGEVLNGPARR